MDGEAIFEILPETPTGAEGMDVINETDYGAVRALFERGVAKKTIARQLELDIKTVRKYLRSPWKPQTRPSARGSALDAFRQFILGRAPEVGFNAKVLHRELQALGYAGAYRTLVGYLRPLRDGARPAPEPVLRFETEPGKQAQVDWGSTSLWLDTEHRRVHIFTMILGYSRRIFARAYPNERLDALLDAHAQAFAHFGGRTESALYDNPRTIVLARDLERGTVTWNATFKDRMDFYGLETKLCGYYRAQTKGKVESGVKYVKRNALAGRRFRSIDHLNEWLLEWCVTIADQRIHGTTHERPADRFARAEAEALIRVDERPPSRTERVHSRIVPRDTLVSIETNRYPVPVEWICHRVEVRLLADQIVITGPEGAALTYDRLEGKHQLAAWTGAPRQFAPDRGERISGLPRFDPTFLSEIGWVEPRPLSCYEELVEEVGR